MPTPVPHTTICCPHVLCQIQDHLCQVLYNLSLCHLVMYKLASDIISKHCCQELFTHLPPCTTTMFYMLSTCLQRAAVHDVFWVKFGVVSPGSRPQPRHLVASVLFCLLFLAYFFGLFFQEHPTKSTASNDERHHFAASQKWRHE